MINSDDPAYFGGYIAENYIALVRAVNLDVEDIILLAKNSFKATFLCLERKQYYIELID